jgi:hypothetical protein
MKTNPIPLYAPPVLQWPIKKSLGVTWVKRLRLTLLFVFLLAQSHLLNAQCVAPYMSFHSPVLIAGTDNQVGAVYLFPEVMAGVDANIKIAGFTGGAQLYNIDDSTGIGYYDAFQPYVVAPADSVSYVDWEITFKVAGTSTDTALACFAITGVDVDGNGSSLQEFIEAATPGSYALDPATILNFSFDGQRSKAISLVDNIPSIDTAHREAMFQMNFTNISTLQYRNGAISSYSSDMVRQTCIYFKSFFDSYLLLLPVKLNTFSAQPQHESITIRWSATNENDLKYYIVQKSINGNSWQDIHTVLPGDAGTNNYFITDASTNTPVAYYRLKQVTRAGTAVYSKVLKVTAGAGKDAISNNTLVKDAVVMQISASVSDSYNIQLHAINGTRIKQQQVPVFPGFNTVSVEVPASAANGLYVLSVTNARGELLHHSKLVKN